ncbi:MAG: hypothetical protein L0Z62_14850 [Gemmataceae bacterium]|nr:hypothetical protein [Gemmataceae bacterium]
MYRRVVCLLLMPCLLLTQAASVGHCHGGFEPAGHELRPHFHTQPPPVRQDHHHGHGGHHHHHDDGDEVPEPDTQPTPQPEPLSDHDSDAVFITSVDVVLNARSAVDDGLTASSLLAAGGSNLFIAFWPDPPNESANWTHSPPSSGCSCPLHVRHRALLI